MALGAPHHACSVPPPLWHGLSSVPALPRGGPDGAGRLGTLRRRGQATGLSAPASGARTRRLQSRRPRRPLAMPHIGASVHTTLLMPGAYARAPLCDRFEGLDWARGPSCSSLLRAASWQRHSSAASRLLGQARWLLGCSPLSALGRSARAAQEPSRRGLCTKRAVIKL